MKIALQAKVKTEIERFKLEQADEALTRSMIGRIRGAAVLVIG
jgi:D-arabinose 1-dehydrogenase-like Zn-dependent alcohol dehydrogenase